jgi:succinate dehydrogenase / fumarate reductase membrane anchor subunit
MRTPLGLVRGLGSAKSGTTTFIRERMTGVFLGLSTPYMFFLALWLFGKPREYIVAHLGSLWVAPPLIAFILINALHMKLGMQVIIEDYVHGAFGKYTLLSLNWMFSWGVALLAVLAILKIVATVP